MKPYLGITGYKTPAEIAHSAAAFRTPPKEYTLMLGIITSEKHAADYARAGRQSPAVQDIAALAAGAPSWSLPMLHYWQEDAAGFDDRVRRLCEYTGVRAVQLNITWPHAEEVRTLAREGIVVTFQVSCEMASGKDLSQRLQEYADCAQYGLVDLSSGKGVPLDVNQSRELLTIVRENLPRSTPILAGGLRGETVYSIMSQFSQPLGCDAQKGVMTDNSLDPQKVATYLCEGRRLWEKR